MYSTRAFSMCSENSGPYRPLLRILIWRFANIIIALESVQEYQNSQLRWPTASFHDSGFHQHPSYAVTPCNPSEGCYKFCCLVNRGTMGVNRLPKTVTWQRRHCNVNPGPSAPESSTLTTWLLSHTLNQYTTTFVIGLHLKLNNIL